uniref:lysozyme n=1 Tax=Strongyloides papillosus TaxID=174720 RepID=A0A0N5CH27_STREA
MVIYGTLLYKLTVSSKGCRPIGCNPDRGSLSCGYYQIKLPYYKDCGEPGKRAGESTENAWKRCSDDYACATTCVENYFNRYRYKCPGKSDCEAMARLHNGGPNGCQSS